MVIIPWTITSYCPVDIPHIKLLTQSIFSCIPTNVFGKKHDDQSTGVEANHTRRISLLLAFVLGSTLDSYNYKDILLMVGFNYNLHIYYHTVSMKFMRKIIVKIIYTAMKSADYLIFCDTMHGMLKSNLTSHYYDELL